MNVEDEQEEKREATKELVECDQAYGYVSGWPPLANWVLTRR